MPGPQGYNPWMGPPPHPMMPGPWMQPWPPGQYPGPQPWMPTQSVQTIGNVEDPKADEYMVNSLRRIYSNEDSSIEIERVKVQRRQPNISSQGGPPALTFPGYPHPFRAGPGAVQSMVPVAGPQLPPQRRPPPRKHRKNRLNNELVPAQQVHPNSYAPYYPPPYMPYMPYPYPYPYPCFNYMWPPTSQSVSPEMKSWEDSEKSKTEDSPRSQQRSLPASPDSQRLDSGTTRSIRDSITPESGRPLSPNAPSQVSQITESQATDIGPSDSVSVGGYCKGNKTGPFKSLANRESDWMVEMQRNLANIDTSSEAGDRSSFTTAPSDIASPPSRRNKLKESFDPKKPGIDADDAISTMTDKSESDINLAFKDLEQSVGYFKDEISKETSKPTQQPTSTSVAGSTGTNATQSNEIREVRPADGDGRSSTTSFHSTRNASDIVVAETDSTDIFVATDTATADEDPPETRKPPLPPSSRPGCASPALEGEEPPPGEGYKWVLQGKGEAPDLTLQQGTNTWLADVSLWRARLVVSLDRGQGLDQQDWATFHLLIQHPLPLHMKLSLLHAPRICAANTDIGAVRVRTALLQLARHAQVLLQTESERPSGWRSITAHNNQPWMPVKGGIELLRILGYRNREDGTLKFSRRLTLEASHLARLTLDLLVFADELRLYLTGGHPHPTNISDLFCPITVSSSVSPEPLAMQMNIDKPSSPFTSSADFVSAESTPVMERKSSKKTEDNAVSEIDSAHHSVKVDYNQQLLDHRSSSEEDVTLHEDDDPKIKSKTLPLAAKDSNQCPNGSTNQRFSTASSLGAHSSANSERLSISTDMTSLPDLQTMSSLPPSRLSNVTKFDKQSDCSALSTPVETPLPPAENNDVKNQKNGRREDHIYEEIGEIRAQVLKLRSSVSVPNLPPPLPPKIRSNQDDESSVTYSRSEWSGASSMGGSVGRRRRKRRAPLPPSFLYEDQIRETNTWEEQSGPNDVFNTTSESISSSVSINDPKIDKNPFYEEIGEARPKIPPIDETTKQSKPMNPFYDTKPIPSGYIGANPFYEDVSLLKSSTSRQISQTESISDDTTANMMNSSIDLQFDQSDGKTPPVAAARPKRRAPRPPKVPKDETPLELNNSEKKSKEPPDLNGMEIESKNEESRRTLPRIPSDSELQDVDLNSITEETVEASPRKVNVPSKNVNQKQLPSSQVVVSVDGGVIESKDNTTKNHVPGKPITESSTTLVNSTEIVKLTSTKSLPQSEETADTRESQSDAAHAKLLNQSIQVNEVNDNRDSNLVDETVSITNEVNITMTDDVSRESDVDTKAPPAMENTLQNISSTEKVTVATDDLHRNSLDLSKKTIESSNIDDSPSSSDPLTVLSNKNISEPQAAASELKTSNDASETSKEATKTTSAVQLVEHSLSDTRKCALQRVSSENKLPESKTQSSNGINYSGSETNSKFKKTYNEKTNVTGDDVESKSITLNGKEDSAHLLERNQTEVAPPPPRPQKAVLNLIEDIPYIDNNDVKNYKYAMVQAKRSPGNLRRRAVSPIEFLQKSMPYIDDNTSTKELEPLLLPPPPPPPPSNPPPPSPPNSPPQSPPNSPPSTPPLLDAEDIDISESSSGDKLQNRLSKISETTELEENKIDKIDEKDELTSPIVFRNPEFAIKKPDRVSSGYYEIPETPGSPPPLPAKPTNLKNVCLLQRTPEIPPKSSKVTAPKASSSDAVPDDGRYEIPDVTKASSMATQAKASVLDTTDEASLSTNSILDSTADESSNPNKPPRRRRYSIMGSPPRPPKNFSGQFPGARAATLPSDPRTPTLSVSTPSTPRPITRPKLQQSVPEKSRKSWPFLFCDCIDTNYEPSTNTRSRPRT